MITTPTTQQTKAETGGQKSADQPKPPFDDKGHLPLTDVPNKDQEHVHEGQIIDKGVEVSQNRQDALPAHQSTAELHVARAAIPTTADDPRVKDPHINPQARSAYKDAETIKEEDYPENAAREQTKQLSEQDKQARERADKLKKEDKNPPNPQENKVFNRTNDLQGQPEHRKLTGDQDGAIPGSRVGLGMEVAAEHLIGDKVHDIHDDGTSTLKIQTRDKSRATSVHGDEDPKTESFHKMKVSFTFPSINPHVAQKELSIQVGSKDKMSEPCIKLLAPDTANLEVFLPLNEAVHVELTHIDQNGVRAYPYILNFYTNPGVTPSPLEASPIGFKMMGTSLVKDKAK